MSDSGKIRPVRKHTQMPMELKSGSRNRILPAMEFTKSFLNPNSKAIDNTKILSVLLKNMNTRPRQDPAHGKHKQMPATSLLFTEMSIYDKINIISQFGKIRARIC